MTGRLFHTSLHAEMNVLFKSLKLFNKTNKIVKCKNKNKAIIDRPATTMYVVRLSENRDKNGNHFFGKCSPCQNCQKWLHYYNVKRVKYTDIIDGVTVLCELRAN